MRTPKPRLGHALALAVPNVRSTWAALTVAVFLATIGNLRLWRALATGPSAVSWAAMVAACLGLLALLNVPLQAIAVPWLFKPLSIAVVLFSAITSYFMLGFGTLIDVNMVRSVLRTDAVEAGELITLRCVAYVVVVGVVPAAVIALSRVRYGPARTELALRAKVVVATLAVAIVAVLPAYKQLRFVTRGDPRLRFMANPVSPLASLIVLAFGEHARHSATLKPIAVDAHRRVPLSNDHHKRRVVIFVLGETAAAGHFSLNGYGRNTNPELAARGVLNFPRVTACATATVKSVPCIFSPLTHKEFSRSRAQDQQNMLDVLQRVGITVFWRDNDAGCEGVCDRVPSEAVRGPPELRHQNEYYDEALLTGLQEHIDVTRGDLFIVLHQKGSHGPAYYRRSPPTFKRFLPECSRPDLQNCQRDQLLNAFDNSILYTDHVLAGVVDLLAANSAKAEVALLYVSDHGESLGENGIFLHGFPDLIAPEEQKRVPMVFWASPDFLAAKALRQEDIRALAAREYSHDNIFHTVLGMFDIETAAYARNLDIFASRLP
ncbi:MAG: phosphoethanolamine--lipid A transferase [Gemmatimonadaceae bacterium]